MGNVPRQTVSPSACTACAQSGRKKDERNEANHGPAKCAGDPVLSSAITHGVHRGVSKCNLIAPFGRCWLRHEARRADVALVWPSDNCVAWVK
jgi:hypothetical protein